MKDLDKVLEKLHDDFPKVTQKPSEDALIRFSSSLGSLEHQLREHIQNVTKKEIIAVIHRLRSNKGLSAEQLAMVKLWIVGDAERYTKLEDNHDDWVAELTRLTDELYAAKGKTMDIATAMHLRALIYDATRVMDDLIFYVQHQERLARFLEATKELDEEEQMHLANILENKLESEQF